MIAQLIEQAFAQIAASNALRIELPDNFKRFVQIAERESYIWNSGARGRCASRSVARMVRALGRRDGSNLTVIDSRRRRDRSVGSHCNFFPAPKFELPIG